MLTQEERIQALRALVKLRTVNGCDCVFVDDSKSKEQVIELFPHIHPAWLERGWNLISAIESFPIQNIMERLGKDEC